MSAPPPIIFTVTDAGRQAALDTLNTGLTLRLTHIALGSGTYATDGTETTLQDELGRWPLSGGDVEPNSNTLRFFSSVVSATSFDAFEAGLFDENNVLFAVASRTNGIPLIPVHANIAFIGSYGLKLTNIPANAVSVVTDPNAALAAMLLLQHTTHANPHPQYAMAAQNDLEHANLVTLIAGVVQALQQHEDALNPHPQYAFASEINPRHLFRFIHNHGEPYSMHHGVAAGSVSHLLEGAIYSLGNPLNDYDVLYVEPVHDYVVQGITMGSNLNQQGYLLRFDGHIQFGNYAGQGDTSFSHPTAKIRFLDEDFQFLLEVPINLTLIHGGFANNGNVGHSMYRVSTDFDLYNLRKPNGQTPTALHAGLSVTGISDSDGGSPDLQILTVESFAIFCSY